MAVVGSFALSTVHSVVGFCHSPLNFEANFPASPAAFTLGAYAIA
jgi:hypothetical protein